MEYVVMCPRLDWPPGFFYCFARYPSNIDYAGKKMNWRSGRKRVSAETLGQYEVPILSSDDLELFSSVVPSMFKAMSNGAFENIWFASVRDALLPRLMSGEINMSTVRP